jgi:hypothetical protein
MTHARQKSKEYGVREIVQLNSNTRQRKSRLVVGFF